MATQTACRAQSPSEEVANSLSHGFGAVAAAALSPQLITAALQAGWLQGAAAAVYCASMVLLYAVSAAYHWLPPGATKDLLRRLDHAAIFLFIAGSYTPLVLGILADQGYWFLAVVWLIATVGTVAKCANRLTHPFLSTAIYMGLGWLCIFILQPLMSAMPVEGLTLLMTGGALYTLGAVVFHFDERIPYAHFVWHLLVLGASGCHFVAVMRYAHG